MTRLYIIIDINKYETILKIYCYILPHLTRFISMPLIQKRIYKRDAEQIKRFDLKKNVMILVSKISKNNFDKN